MATEVATDSKNQLTPESFITKGKTFLVVHDYYNAVGTLAEGVRLLVEKYSDMADELAEPYLYYGRALLGLAREEQAVLGTGVPGVPEPEAEEEEEEPDAAAAATADGEGEPTTASDAPKAKPDEQEEKKDEAEKSEPSNDKVEDKNEEKPEEAAKEDEKVTNGNASASTSAKQNGDAHENGDAQMEEEEEDAEEDENEEEDDGSTNLQIAWEVLELSKVIIQKRAESAERTKFLAETHRLLGEVALESGHQVGAIGDLSTCLDLMQTIDKITSRQLAEVYYQLGLAYSLGNEYNSSIEHFEKALKHLDERIDYLKSLKETPKDADPSFSAEEEIKEIEDLIPEIKEKIDDMKDMKQQACKALLDSIKDLNGEGSSSKGAGPSGASTSSDAGASSGSSSASADAKPASDISHLVRKKRKNEDGESEMQASPCKKPSPVSPGKSA
ncbi:protein HGV2 [Copidosoma floridanum]|uniref:protein HGV2 n=1 Tax=Copidosoma floridanum TaxID=29053 RepID=UPI000C6F79F1|nr:protein HGV2 [Copidosoma floridanum]